MTKQREALESKPWVPELENGTGETEGVAKVPLAVAAGERPVLPPVCPKAPARLLDAGLPPWEYVGAPAEPDAGEDPEAVVAFYYMSVSVLMGW